MLKDLRRWFYLVSVLILALVLKLAEFERNPYGLWEEYQNLDQVVFLTGSDSNVVSHGSNHINTPSLLCSAEEIIRHSYDRHYKPFVEYCSSNRMKNETLKTCFANYLKMHEPPHNHQDIAWWLSNMMEISKKGNGLFGKWHELWATNPDVRICSIEKVATTKWRQVHTQLHNGDLRGTYGWNRHNSTTQGSYIVFLRDPLERFLSGYIDKCRKVPREGHCAPGILYHNKDLNLLQKMKQRHHFESFVSAVPFGWNVHFLPQALYCEGLFRTMDWYDFVGSMDSDTFTNDLIRLKGMFQGDVGREIQKAFDLERNVTEFRTVLEEKRNRHFTNAPKQVLEYYSADTVRQVLMFLSIDYVTLNLTVPNWARTMLEQDCRQPNR